MMIWPTRKTTENIKDLFATMDPALRASESISSMLSGGGSISSSNHINGTRMLLPMEIKKMILTGLLDTKIGSI